MDSPPAAPRPVTHSGGLQAGRVSEGRHDSRRCITYSTMSPSGALLAKILRLPLSLIPRETQVRVLRGPLRGMKWIKGAGPNAYWFGTYEVARVRAFANIVTQGAVVYDVGANVGIYSLLASLRAGTSGRVYAFEPLGRNLQHLRRHIAPNTLQNCTVF